MKTAKLLPATALIFYSLVLPAQKVALHSPGGTNYFDGINGLSMAYNAASSGDTIYLPGGSFNPPANIDKRLVIYGAGHYVDSTLATGKTIINNNVVYRGNSDNSLLEGVEITGTLTFAWGEAVDGVTIRRCKINGHFIADGDLSAPAHNLALTGNVFTGHIIIPNCVNALISNNIIQYGVDGTNGNVISNNIFLSRLTNGSYENYRGSNNQLSNNIFILQGSYGMTSGTGNVYSNNVMAFANPSYGTSSTTINNYTGIDPASVFISHTGNVFSYGHDYHVQSPGVWLGADGTEAGIYGGVFPYKEGAVPSNPHIRFRSIAPQTNSEGELNIQIRVGAQND